MKRIRTFILNSGAALLFSSFLAPGRADILYVANEVNNTIERFSSSGSDLGIFATHPLTGAAAFGLAFDSSANLFVAYPNLPTNLTKFSVTGAYLFSFAPGLGYLQGIAFDRAGNLYVANAT